MKLSKKIKAVLIDMTIDGEIPSDLNQLDETIFEFANKFQMFAENLSRLNTWKEICENRLKSEDPDCTDEDITDYTHAEQKTLDELEEIWDNYQKLISLSRLLTRMPSVRVGSRIHSHNSGSGIVKAILEQSVTLEDGRSVYHGEYQISKY